MRLLLEDAYAGTTGLQSIGAGLLVRTESKKVPIIGAS